MNLTTRLGCEKLLLGQLEKDLAGIPTDAIHSTLEPEHPGGRRCLPKTRDPFLLETWALLEWMVRKAHHEILCYPREFIRLFRLDEIFGSNENARRQVYRLLALNGHRLHRVRKIRLAYEPSGDRLPSDYVQRQRKSRK